MLLLSRTLLGLSVTSTKIVSAQNIFGNKSTNTDS
ncbi:hypothetical protein T05_893 [Trichinella murrelli]|uniref:Uncharacterized protein n=1 Tax=Trichinella murrelli TaxID=144512 RepID=A0A0V0ST17_9BILA|nr:hypothetical protein T05_5841 [Trichinella murrelli]KRX29873.1 hypothetical protein T05_893 [Trichinella murrelli]